MKGLWAFGCFVVAGWSIAGCDSSDLTPVKDPSEWGKQEVLIMREDLATLFSGVVESGLIGAAASPLPGEIEGVNVTLVDAAGKLRIELVVSRQAMTFLRLESPGDQVKALLGLKQNVLSLAEQVVTPGRSLFAPHVPDETPSGQQSALRRLFGEVAGSGGGVMVVGFEHEGQLHVYATVTGGQVEFNQDAPDGRIRLRGWQ